MKYEAITFQTGVGIFPTIVMYRSEMHISLKEKKRMIININDINQTLILLILIYITYTFVWWSQIRHDCPILLESMRYNASNKCIIHVDNSIENIN